MEYTKKQNIFDDFIVLPNYLCASFFFFSMFLLLVIFFFSYNKEKVIYATNENDVISFYYSDVDFIYEDNLYINNKKYIFEIVNIEKNQVNNVNIVRIKINKKINNNKIVKLTFISKKTTLIKELINLLKKGILT